MIENITCNRPTLNWNKLIVPLAFAILIEGCFVAGVLGGGAFVSLGGAAVFALLSFLAPVDVAVLVFLCLLPNQRMAVLEWSNISLLNVGVLILGLRMLTDFKSRPFSFWGASLLLVILSAIVCYTTKSFTRPILFLKIFVELAVFASIFFRKANDPYWFFKCGLFFSLGAVFMGGIEFLRGADSSSVARLGVGDELYNNPNMMGNTFSFAFAAILLIFSYYRSRFLLKMSMIGGMLLLVVLGVFTGSRAFFLAMAAIFFGYFFVNMSSGRAWKGVFFSVFVGVLVVVFSIAFPESFLGRAWENSIDRIVDPRGGDISGGRFEIWNEYWTVYTSNMWNILWGASEDPRLYYMEAMPHNAFLSMLVGWGVMGCSLWLVLLFSVFRQLYVRMKQLYGNPSVVGLMLPCLIVLHAMTRTNLLDMTTVALMFVGCIGLFIKKFQDYPYSRFKGNKIIS